MKLDVSKLLESVLKEASEEDETIVEDGAIAAPATNTTATNDSLPIPPLGKPARRKNLEDEKLS